MKARVWDTSPTTLVADSPAIMNLMSARWSERVWTGRGSWLCLISVPKPALRARSAQSLSTDSCPLPHADLACVERASRTSSRGVLWRRAPSSGTCTSPPSPDALRVVQAAPGPCRCRPPTLPAGRAARRRSVSAIRLAGGGACQRRRP
eukprot:3940682-Rhodomonas_salina.2